MIALDLGSDGGDVGIVELWIRREFECEGCPDGGGEGDADGVAEHSTEGEHAGGDAELVFGDRTKNGAVVGGLEDA